jgi:hypothetical protein
MSIIANIVSRLNIKWFRKSEPSISTIPEPTDVWVPPPVIETPAPKAKPKSNRKPGPKKHVPGTPAVKPQGSTPKKPRTYNKPKKKVDDA